MRWQDIQRQKSSESNSKNNGFNSQITDEGGHYGTIERFAIWCFRW